MRKLGERLIIYLLALLSFMLFFPLHDASGIFASFQIDFIFFVPSINTLIYTRRKHRETLRQKNFAV